MWRGESRGESDSRSFFTLVLIDYMFECFAQLAVSNSL